MNRLQIPALVVAVFSAAGLAHAADADATPEVGKSTRNWVALQRSGSQAGAERPMLGATSVLSYQRYVDSYKYKVPEYYPTDITRGGGSGGSR